MKALQILQTIMLSALIAGAALIGNTTLESAKFIAEMRTELRAMGADNDRLATDVQRLLSKVEDLDHRVTVLETRGH